MAASIPAGLALFVAAAFDHDKDFKIAFILISGLSLIGGVAGINGGLSRVGAVGDIIPASLALIGSVSLYIFGIKSQGGPLASLCAASFAVALGFGYALGATERGKNDNFDYSVAFCSELFSDHEILASDTAYERSAQIFGQACMEVLGSKFNTIIQDADGDATESSQKNFILQFQFGYDLTLDRLYWPKD